MRSDTSFDSPRSGGSEQSRPQARPASWPGMEITQQGWDYWIDACQRSILFLDVLRQRGNNYFERAAETTPNVLHFRFEPVMSGGELRRPVMRKARSAERRQRRSRRVGAAFLRRCRE